MKVLVTNDDGINGIGLKILVEHLSKYAEKIYVVAPSVERSAASHTLTIRNGIKCIKHQDIIEGVPTYSINAYPADCVIFAAKALKLDFDTVFSGINRGYNLGNDIVYSGTVAAGMEALMKGYKCVAVSCRYDSFDAADNFDTVMDYLLSSKIWNEKVLLNINIPINPKGIKITHQALSTYISYYIDSEDGLYYTECDLTPPLSTDEDGDIQCIKKGYISISPLTYNRTDNNIYNKYH